RALISLHVPRAIPAAPTHPSSTSSPSSSPFPRNPVHVARDEVGVEGAAGEGVAREGVRVRVRGSAVDLASMGGLFLRERVSWGQEWVDQLRADTWMHAFSFTGAQQQEAGRERQGWDEGGDRGNSDKDVKSGGVSAAGYAGAAPQERDTGNSTAEGESAGTAMREGGSAGSAVDSGDSGAVDVFQVLLDASHGTAEVLVELPLRAHSGSQPRWVLVKLLLTVADQAPNRLLVRVAAG
ncbi:unnamed protein product, partial [Closterium sp. Naga37s-1]